MGASASGDHAGGTAHQFYELIPTTKNRRQQPVSPTRPEAIRSLIQKSLNTSARGQVMIHDHLDYDREIVKVSKERLKLQARFDRSKQTYDNFRTGQSSVIRGVISGKLMKHGGDKVLVEMTPYDLIKGRNVYRAK